jgi:hypothetical protein
MAARKKKKSGRPRHTRTGAGQRILVALSAVVLVLCAASVTFSLFTGSSEQGSGPLTVAIRNGTGISGIAGDAETALTALGVKIVGVGNADHFSYAESVLVVRRRGADVALLAERIGCKRVTRQHRKDAAADAELILGADYRDLSLGAGR